MDASAFHAGEQQLQQRSGVRDRLEAIGHAVMRDHMPQQHREFFAKLPTLLLGGGAGTLKGGRHLVYPADTPLTNLQLTLLHKMGVPAERLGDSTGQFNELSDLA